MNRVLQVIFTLLVLTLLLGCTGDKETERGITSNDDESIVIEETAETETIESDEDEQTEASTGVFYKVEHGSTTVYLLGSIHIGNEDLYPLHESIETAFDEANYLAVEVDITEMNEAIIGPFLMEHGVYMDGRTLEGVIGTDYFELLYSIVGSAEMQREMLQLFRPWVVKDLFVTTVAEENGYYTDYGIDLYFLERAIGNIDIIALENIEDQLALNLVMSEDAQIEELLLTIDSYKDAQSDLIDLVESWRTGDVEALLEMRALDDSNSEEHRNYMLAMTDERDKKMALQIEEFLLKDEGETYFVVVGALHLVGDNSIVDLLQKKGFEVQEGIQ